MDVILTAVPWSGLIRGDLVPRRTHESAFAAHHDATLRDLTREDRDDA